MNSGSVWGKEQLLAADAIRRDGVETGLRGQPLVPCFGFGGFHVRPLGGVDQDAVVGVEQGRVALGENFEVLAVLEFASGGSVGERVGVARPQPTKLQDRRRHCRARSCPGSPLS